MRGLITETHFEMAERWYPGIRDLYAELDEKPQTFLQLVWEYEQREVRSRPETLRRPPTLERQPR